MCFTISNYNDKVYQKPSVQANIDNTSLVFNKLQVFKHKFTQFCQNTTKTILHTKTEMFENMIMGKLHQTLFK